MKRGEESLRPRRDEETEKEVMRNSSDILQKPGKGNRRSFGLRNHRSIGAGMAASPVTGFF
jgi:hypothetical protein